MGARLPEQVAESGLNSLLVKKGVKLVCQGKIRDTYTLPDYPDLLLVVATDRLSIFDFVLPCLVPDKGEVLTALTVFWLIKVLSDFNHHLMAFGREIGRFLPNVLRGNYELWTRSLIVKKLKIIPIECVIRGYLTGSGWKSYQQDRTVCGQQLPEGLYDGAKLPYFIFTPSTKTESGHDIPLTSTSVTEKYGIRLEELTLGIYTAACKYAFLRDIIIADTKFEFDEGFVLADEVLTPDSSRFWDKKGWEAAVLQKRAPTGYDKEPVRQWGKTVKTPFEGIVGINNLDPENSEHLAFVAQLIVPQEVISATTQRYRTIFQRLTSFELEVFQGNVLGVKTTI